MECGTELVLWLNGHVVLSSGKIESVAKQVVWKISRNCRGGILLKSNLKQGGQLSPSIKSNESPMG
jgi:hypothetical protein